MVVALFPGTFDPVTLGHVDIATRASRLFERVVVAVYETPARPVTFTARERVSLLREALSHLPNVEVRPFRGLVVELARNIGARVIVRGLRRVADFEYEFEMAFMNRKLAPEVEVVCLFSSPEYHYVSASLLKEVAALGGEIESLVPPNVARALMQKIRQGKSDKEA